MNADSPAIVQSVTLASVFVAIAAITDTVYALASVLARARRVRTLGRYLTGAPSSTSRSTRSPATERAAGEM
jgi:hypothetical protein